MKSHRRLSSPENPVNFLNIILSDDTQSTGIRLPEKFTEEYGKLLSETVTLKVPNGDVWHVGLQKTRDEIWLKNGWEKLVERYDLGFSNLLMFKFQGFSTFDVIIFDASALEIKYPKNTDRITSTVKQEERTSSVSSDEEEIVVLDDDDDDDDDDTSASWSEDEQRGMKIYDEGECSRTRRMTDSEEQRRRALEKAKEIFKCDEPFFMVYVNESHFKRGVFLPVAFRRELLRGYGDHRECLLRAEDDGEMKTCMVVAHNRYWRRTEWLMFVEDNGIKVGDICVFKLIHQDKGVIGVSILRSGF